MSIKSDLKERRKVLKAQASALVDGAERAGRAMSDAESRQFDKLLGEARELDDRIEELDAANDAESRAAAHRVATKATSSTVTRSRAVYNPHDGETSFFRDLIDSQRGNLGAIERLARNNDAAGNAFREFRAADMTSVAGAGGEFAPPLWAIEDWVALARPHRVTADLLNKQVLPSGVSSINLPAVASGASVAVQQTQGTNVSDTALTTTSVSSGITTLAGKQIVSIQLLRQSGINFDQVILSDLAAEYAKQLDIQVLSGTGANGQLKGLDTAAGNTITFTNTQPVVYSSTTAASFYFQILSAINKVNTGRYLPPTAIVMHPRRWAWVLNASDGQNRPLITPAAGGMNVIGTASEEAAAEGSVGTLLGVPVYIDASVSTTANSSTNQDEVFVLRGDDSWLYETPMEAASFDATYADSASILYRVLGFAALAHRYTRSVSKIVGSGCVDPGI